MYDIVPHNNYFDTGNISISNILVKYDRIHQTIVSISTGGPATDVTWYKDNTRITIPNEGGTYSYSQIIINTTMRIG